MYEFVSLRAIFFNDTATTEIYTLSLHDALPICERPAGQPAERALDELPVGLGLLLREGGVLVEGHDQAVALDRKSTRLNSSHANISYAVFCLKKKELKNMIFMSFRSLSKIYSMA